jgi:hypothetical protein
MIVGVIFNNKSQRMANVVEKKIALEWKLSQPTRAEKDFFQPDLTERNRRIIADEDFIYIGVSSQREKIYVLDISTLEVSHILELRLDPPSTYEDPNSRNADIAMAVTEDYLIANVGLLFAK